MRFKDSPPPTNTATNHYFRLSHFCTLQYCSTDSLGPNSLKNLSHCTSLFSNIWQTESVEAKRILYYVVFTNALSPHILSYMWYLLSTLPPPPPRAIHRWQHTHRIFQCAFLNGSVTLFLMQLSFPVSLPHWRSTGSVHAGGGGVI